MVEALKELVDRTGLQDRVVSVIDADSHWPFDGKPYVVTRPRKGHPQTVYVDPFPCYAHNRDLAVAIAERVEAAFPVGYPPHYYLLPFDTPNQTNGWADKSRSWVKRDGKWVQDGWDPFIVLAGKRIPLHPAMTRYLVAHEYGHVVNWWLEDKRGQASDEAITPFDREYAALRGIEPNSGYGGRRWHANVGELIANDFRICVCGIEAEFWPHPGFDHPHVLHKVQEFWNEMVREHAAT